MIRGSLIVLLVLLVGCKDKGSTPPPPPPPPPPVAGTVLSSECQEYTLVEQVADGSGGSTERSTPRSEACGWNPPPAGTVLDSECQEYTLVENIADGAYGSQERVTPRSEACGWNPPPAGKLAEERCEEPYTLVQTYHDGEYGFYDETYPDSEQCGYIPPVLNVTIDNTYGDRFKPVIVTVEYTVQGKPAEWSFDAEAGRAVKVDENTLHIYGNGEGNSVDFVLFINEESYLYQLKAEPVCAVEDRVDCVGYRQLSNQEFIYYGEDDTQIVPVEIVLTKYDRESTEPVPIPLESVTYKETVSRVAKWNDMLAKDGIYVEFRLVGAYYWSNGDLRRGEQLMRSLPTDIGLGRGTTYAGTCGVAYPNTTFYKAGFGFSACGHAVDLHEMGHVIGLAHGPNNSSNASTGYIFPDFGHGDYDQCGSRTDDIMSYGSKDHFFNSKQTCDGRFPDRNYVGPAGDRNRADTAYHWNRVRYSLSLIHNEHAQNEKSPKAISLGAGDGERPLIID